MSRRDHATTPIRRSRGGEWHGDLDHIGDFMRRCCRRSPYGVPVGRLYDRYLTATPNPAPYGLFLWWLRQRHDTAWLGPRSGGEWLVGVSLYAPASRSGAA